MKTRTDVIFTQPLEIRRYFSEINEDLRTELNNDDLYTRSLLNPRIIKGRRTRSEITDCSKLAADGYSEGDSSQLLYNINHKNYLWTFGTDWVCIGKRHVMDQLPSLVFWYGSFDTGLPFTFNAETQFVEYCKHKNITNFHYLTHCDGQYLASRENNLSLIDKDGNLSPNIDDLLVVTIVRDEHYHF